MSVNTMLGVLFGFGLFIGAVLLSTNNYIIFLSLPSLLMVGGGTLAAAFISYESRYVLLGLKNILSILIIQRVGRNVLNFEVGRIIRWGYVVQAKGPLALEQEIKALKREDKFLGFGVELLVTGYNGTEVRNIMGNAADCTFERSVVQADIIKNMGATAPAFGMIGTLVGLVVMLDNLSGDLSELGKGMSLALITTLYGVLFARLVFIPAASKIRQREEIKRFRNYLVAEGLAMLADRKNPRYVQDMMNSFLDPAIHFNIDQQLKQRAGGKAA
ncbi:MAG: MotA/TolQ/ExbB proton channel family protein [Pseudomonadota bacterium]